VKIAPFFIKKEWKTRILLLMERGGFGANKCQKTVQRREE